MDILIALRDEQSKLQRQLRGIETAIAAIAGAQNGSGRGRPSPLLPATMAGLPSHAVSSGPSGDFQGSESALGENQSGKD